MTVCFGNIIDVTVAQSRIIKNQVLYIILHNYVVLALIIIRNIFYIYRQLSSSSLLSLLV